MSTKTDNSKTPTYPVYEMEGKGKLILPESVINQIMYLHAIVGTTEWSGILVYDVLNGNPSKPNEFILEAKHIFLMDIGTSVFTEYQTDGSIVEIYDNIEGSMQMKIGHVHSHHNMNAFFSGTDMGELQDNVDKHNYYLSLIVNFSGNYAAKVAFLSERKITSWMHYTNDQGELKKFKEETVEKTLIVVNMMIQLKYNDPFFYNRILDVKKRIEDEKKKKETTKSVNKSFSKISSSPALQQKFQNFDNDSSLLNPFKLSTNQVELLTRNLLGVNSDLTELRSVYQMLYAVSQGDEEERNFYYPYLEDNIDIVVESFLQKNFIPKDEMEAVLKEAIMSIERFKYHKALEPIVTKVVKVINSFYNTYDIDSEFEEINNAAKDGKY